jgi:hypothetical protein
VIEEVAGAVKDFDQGWDGEAVRHVRGGLRRSEGEPHIREQLDGRRFLATTAGDTEGSGE